MITLSDDLLTFLLSTAQGVFYYLYFRQIAGLRPTKAQDFTNASIQAILYAIYMYYTRTAVIEPFRFLLCWLVLTILYRFCSKRRLSQVATITIISGFIDIVSLFIAAFINGTLTYFVLNRLSTVNPAAQIIYTPLLQVGLNLLLYLFLRKINFTIHFHKDKDFNSPLISALAMMLFAYCSLRVLYSENYALLYLFTWCLFTVGMVFFILYLRTANKKYTEGVSLHQKNDMLRADIHKYEGVLPGLEKKIKDYLSTFGDQKIQEVVSNELSLYQIPSFLHEKERHMKKSIDLPATGSLAVDGYFEEMKKNCLDDDIVFQVMVNPSLQYLEKKKVELYGVSRLVVNIVSNAYKELKKTPNKNKKILTQFLLGEEGHFRISVFDNAHEFDPDVLVRLGRRGNSTNGTGYGWEDNFALLADYRASLEIMEFEPFREEFTKKITVFFDGKNAFSVVSYRPDVIAKAQRQNAAVALGRQAKD